MRLDDYTVSVHTSDGDILPEVEHNGKVYVVSRPGKEFTVTVERCDKQLGSYVYHTPETLVELLIDGQAIGYRKLLLAGARSTFSGYLRSASATGSNVYDAFQFQSATEGTGQPSRGLDPQVGTLRVICSNAVPTGTPTTIPTGPQGRTAAVGAAVEGKKWFMAPSLTTTQGSTSVQHHTWSTYVHQQMNTVADFTLHYETAMTLYLRKVLDPIRDQAILEKCQEWDPTLKALLHPNRPSGSAVGASSSRRPNAEGGQEALVVVKDERAKKRARSDGGGPSSSYEVVDLVKTEVTPVRVNGQEVRRDEVAVCDLVSEDAQWSIRKKRAMSMVESNQLGSS